MCTIVVSVNTCIASNTLIMMSQQQAIPCTSLGASTVATGSGTLVSGRLQSGCIGTVALWCMADWQSGTLAALVQWHSPSPKCVATFS